MLNNGLWEVGWAAEGTVPAGLGGHLWALKFGMTSAVQMTSEAGTLPVWEKHMSPTILLQKQKTGSLIFYILSNCQKLGLEIWTEVEQKLDRVNNRIYMDKTFCTNTEQEQNDSLYLKDKPNSCLKSCSHTVNTINERLKQLQVTTEWTIYLQGKTDQHSHYGKEE